MNKETSFIGENDCKSDNLRCFNNTPRYSNTSYCNKCCCNGCYYETIPGPPGPKGDPGKPCRCNQPCATFIISSNEVEGITVPEGGNLKGWFPPIGVVNSSSISVNSDGIFTLKEAGVYYINSYVSILRGTGYENKTEERLDYSFALSPTSPDSLPSTVFTGLSTDYSSGGILAGTLVSYFPAGFQFRVENSSNIDISIINGVTSGSSASISIFRFADKQSV